MGRLIADDYNDGDVINDDDDDDFDSDVVGGGDDDEDHCENDIATANADAVVETTTYYDNNSNLFDVYLYVFCAVCPDACLIDLQCHRRRRRRKGIRLDPSSLAFSISGQFIQQI